MTSEPTLRQRAESLMVKALVKLPRSIRHLPANRAPRIVDGFRLDPDIQAGLALFNRAEEPLEASTMPQARHRLKTESRLFSGKPARVGQVRDLTAPTPHGDVAMRLYQPLRGPSTSGNPIPLLVFLHGGGWALGDLDTHDTLCRNIAAGAEIGVLAVDYRLAPEHPFPAGLDDCVAAFRWAHEHADELGVDPARIAIGGDSAGANLAAVVCQVCRDESTPMPAAQWLIVPAADASRDYPSTTTFSEGYFLTKKRMDWYKAAYANGHDLADPRISPLLAPSLAGLPPAYIAVAGFDPLRDEGLAYARALETAGVAVTLRVHEEAVHPMIVLGALEIGSRSQTHAINALRDTLHAPTR